MCGQYACSFSSNACAAALGAWRGSAPAAPWPEFASVASAGPKTGLPPSLLVSYRPLARVRVVPTVPCPQRRSGARVPERAAELGVSWTRAAASRGERGPTLGNQARAAPLWTCPGRDDGWDHGSDVSLRPTLAHLSSAPAVLPVVLPKRPSFGQCTPLTASRVCSKHASEALLPAVTTGAPRSRVRDALSNVQGRLKRNSACDARKR